MIRAASTIKNDSWACRDEYRGSCAQHDTLWDKIGDALNAFTPQECAATYFKHAGLASL